MAPRRLIAPTRPKKNILLSIRHCGPGEIARIVSAKSLRLRRKCT